MKKIKDFLFSVLATIGDWLNDPRSDEQLIEDLKRRNKEWL